MFDKLFNRPCTIARQLEAPLASERASFLAQRAEDGAAPDTFRSPDLRDYHMNPVSKFW